MLVKKNLQQNLKNALRLLEFSIQEIVRHQYFVVENLSLNENRILCV